MSKSTTYTCDRCGAQAIEKSDFLRTIAITIYHHGGEYPKTSAQWCESCLVKFGFISTPKSAKIQPNDPQPTMEDLVREIVRQELP